MSSQPESPFSPNVQQITPSATISVSSLAKQLQAEGRDILNLGAGEPDFPTPEFIRAAAVEAVQAGRTRYTPSPGLPALREAIAGTLAAQHGAEVEASQIVVSTGAKQALFNVLFSLVGPGDKVLVPVPYWTSYPQMIELARAEMVPVQGQASRGYRVGADELETAWDPAVKALILNSPSNPSGAVYRLDELEAIAAWARDRGVRVITDEIYARLCYVADRAPGFLDLPPQLREDAAVVNGASKAFAMTGWRIGFSCTTAEVARKMSALQSHITSNAATPSQYAALAAYTATPEQDAVLREMAAAFAARRELVVRLLEERLPGTEYVAPEGAFYLFFRADRWYTDDRPDSVSLCTWLIEEAGVALVPGSAFGLDPFVRLSFAASKEVLVDAFDRLADTLGGDARSQGTA